jgi:putative redox protein
MSTSSRGLEKGAISMQVNIEWAGNVHFKAENSAGHQVPMDGPEEAGGENLGSRPMELILMGLGGCTAYDVVDILQKSRQPLVNLSVSINAQRAEAIPAVFEKITIHFTVVGAGVDPGRVQRAIDLTAEKYCSASIMLKKGGVEITHTFEIVAEG